MAKDYPKLTDDYLNDPDFTNHPLREQFWRAVIACHEFVSEPLMLSEEYHKLGGDEAFNAYEEAEATLKRHRDALKKRDAKKADLEKELAENKKLDEERPQKAVGRFDLGNIVYGLVVAVPIFLILAFVLENLGLPLISVILMPLGLSYLIFAVRTRAGVHNRIYRYSNKIKDLENKLAQLDWSTYGLLSEEEYEEVRDIVRAKRRVFEIELKLRAIENSGKWNDFKYELKNAYLSYLDFAWQDHIDGNRGEDIYQDLKRLNPYMENLSKMTRDDKQFKSDLLWGTVKFALGAALIVGSAATAYTKGDMGGFGSTPNNYKTIRRTEYYDGSIKEEEI